MDCRGAAQVHQQYAAFRFETSLFRKVEQSADRLSLVDGIGHNALGARQEMDPFIDVFGCDAVGIFRGCDDLNVVGTDALRKGQGLQRIVRQPEHPRLLDFHLVIVRYADHPRTGSQRGETGDQSGLRTAAARTVYHIVEKDPKIARLRHNLGGAGQIAHAPQRMIRRPSGNEIGFATLTAQMFGQLLKGAFVLDGTFAFVEIEFGAQDIAEQDIPGLPVSRSGVSGPGTMQQRAFQSASGRCRRGLTGVVRLDRSDRDQRVCTGPQGVAHQEFQLAGLVAATSQSGQVIAFEPEIRPFEVSAEFRELVDRRRQLYQGRSGQVRQPNQPVGEIVFFRHIVVSRC